ncbi:hypothetical protein PAXINDRAFT_99189 [Paxillus involutus ATCC 200175]|uniref:Uncharacterized protein n=1 Tax=Paxillus involutus ATCC 200175 TaxID=664439 RepID=A0A0C9TZG9_PAXIN|nr:hypothetical protein PAXINDRAFT_99189 [Paxillus involutus ATCC 200175]
MVMSTNLKTQHSDLLSSITCFLQSLLEVAIFRSWRILSFFGAWAAAVCLINDKVHSLALQPTLLTVGGTVLGFVISFRTTTSYDRYNEGRRLWSQIVFATRTFARTVWFHVPEDTTGDDTLPKDEAKVRTLIEKKTVINLLEGYAAATKHYLRGEDGIAYKDVHPFVQYLPSYPIPPSIPPNDAAQVNGESSCPTAGEKQKQDECAILARPSSVALTNTSTLRHGSRSASGDCSGASTLPRVQTDLLPSEMPPDRSLKAQYLGLRDKVYKKPQDRRAACRHAFDRAQNVPLEISFYLSSYIAALEARNDKIVPKLEHPTTTLLHTSLSQLVEALSGLERILTTPVIYSRHLTVLTVMYCLLLPFQTLESLGWFTIPATVLASFMFFGFLVAGAELENPFGYDKNDLDMQSFVHGVIRKELHAITSKPTPNPRVWAFSDLNNNLFPSCTARDGILPAEWVERGSEAMLKALEDHVCCD